MGATRSATVALAALLAGPVGPLPATAAGETAAPPIRTTSEGGRTPASDPPGGQAATDAATEAAKPTTPAEAAGLPAEGTDKGSDKTEVGDKDNKGDKPATGGPEEAVAVAPAAPSDPQAAAVFHRLADTAPLLPRLTTKEREALRAFYAAGAFKPVWIEDGAYSLAAKTAAARLAAAGEDGLEPRAYPVPTLPALRGSADQAALAEADLKLSAAVALYARDARGGRVSLAAISRLITPTLDLPTADAVLARVASAGAEAGTVLQGYNPHHAGYLALKARLAALRGPAPAASSGPDLKLPPGPILRPGMRDPRVPLLRARFGLPTRTPGSLDAGPGEPDAYDADVVAAVAGFQRGRGLPGNGVLNAQTVMALANAGARRPAGGDEAGLIVNMERWRWLPAELGSDYVMVNVPEFRLRVFRGGTLRDETRVIVGKTESPTPIFSGLMEYAVVNPSWYVPPSILKTMLPKIASYGGSTYGGYEIVRRGGQISLRQPPGERNALGFIKFMFPNNHAVYLHDTPNRSLFERSDRALSHGCVRVDDPFRFAESVLPPVWSSERLKKLIGKGERTIRLDQKLPVHLAYFTAYLDDSGLYRTAPDLYGYDASMKHALGLPGGAPQVARAPAEAKRPSVAQQPKPKPSPDTRPEPAVRQAAVPASAPRAVPTPTTTRAAPRSAQADTATAGPERELWMPRPEPVFRGWW